MVEAMQCIPGNKHFQVIALPSVHTRSLITTLGTMFRQKGYCRVWNPYQLLLWQVGEFLWSSLPVLRVDFECRCIYNFGYICKFKTHQNLEKEEKLNRLPIDCG
jgi:hypothetical protein